MAARQQCGRLNYNLADSIGRKTVRQILWVRAEAGVRYGSSTSVGRTVVQGKSVALKRVFSLILKRR